MGMAVGQKFVKQEFDETAKDSVGFSLIHKWAATWQNQQSDCAPSEDSARPDQSLSCALNG